MIAWRIYYADGSNFDSTMGSPQEAPSFGIICVIQPNKDVGRTITNGYDWYYYQTEVEEWWQSDIHGLLDSLLHNFPIEAVKQGRNAPNDLYKRIMELAIKDPDFPAKNAMLRSEHP